MSSSHVSDDRFSIQSTATHDMALVVSFQRHLDRYRHTIGLRRGTEWTWLAESVEGDSEQTWPPSPALQQLSIESQRGDRQVALAVGMAGTSHWSMSVEPLENSTGLVMDVACRAKHPPAWLGTTYQLPPDFTLKGDTVEITAPLAGGLLQWRIAEIESDATPQLIQEGSLIRVALPDLPVTYPATIRWKYDIRWSPDVDEMR